MRTSLPARVLAYILTLACVAAGATGAIMTRAEPPAPAAVISAIVLTCVVILSRRAPLPLGPHVKLLVDTAPLVAAALVLPPPLAIAVAALGAALADVTRRIRWFQALYHTSETTLRVALATEIYHLVAGDARLVDLHLGRLTVAVVAALAAIYLVNVLLLEGLIALQSGRISLRAVASRRREDGAGEAALASLGLLAAILTTTYPLAVVLLAPPAIAVYVAMRTSLIRLERLDHRASHDMLTGLPNRASFTDFTNAALARAASRSQPVAVLFIDLDGFKEVNDTLGHGAGDQLLTALGDRLVARAHPGVLIARFGGDEFTALVEGEACEGAMRVAQELLQFVTEPIPLGEQELQIGASIGVAWSANGSASADELLRNADIAMYHAKAEGKGRCSLFAPAMQEAISERVELERDLRRAIPAGQLVAYYQPKVDLVTGRVIGTEALVRWRHPVQGMIPPGRFIPMAEETGLVVPLGRWMLREACAQLCAWHLRFPAGADGAPLSVSVNLSARQVTEPGIVDEVAAIVAESGIEPGSLVLEVTESAMMGDADLALETLRAIKGLGVRLALDDFGTGYSSLSYLSRFPFDLLKIDKAFVDPLPHGRDKDTIVQAIIAMGDALGMHTIAEGIEHQEQADTLRTWGCTYGQGYLFARPLPANDLEALLLRERDERESPGEPLTRDPEPVQIVAEPRQYSADVA